jgi:membrane-associated protease RseP (regulator of RpoE activity)
MPDETSPESSTPDDTTAADATDTTETAQTAPVTTADASPRPAAPAAAGTSDRKGVFVPRWLAVLLGLVLAVVLVGGGGFALGRATADDRDGGGHHGRMEDGPGGMPGSPNGPGRQFPGPPQNGGGNGGNGGNGGTGNGGGSDSAPSTPTSRVFLGVVVEPSGSGTSGAKVVQVESGSPADDAGLQSGDVITKVDDTDITDAAALATAIQSHSSGDEVTITYDRDGTSATAKVSLTDRTQSGLPRTSPPA